MIDPLLILMIPSAVVLPAAAFAAFKARSIFKADAHRKNEIAKLDAEAEALRVAGLGLSETLRQADYVLAKASTYQAATQGLQLEMPQSWRVRFRSTKQPRPEDEPGHPKLGISLEKLHPIFTLRRD